MAVANAAIGKPVTVQSSSDFTLQSGKKAPASFEGNTFNELPDCVIFDRIQQCNRIDSPFENLINELPDHILVSILSLLNLKEAARTSILSHRWTYLSTYTRRLVFDDPLLECTPQKVEVSRFINRVNSTLKVYQGKTLDEFTVCFELDEQICKLDIDSWIIFALEKRAQYLHLDFRVVRRFSPSRSYTLTTQFLSNYITNSLKVLRLIGVHVSGEVVEYILSACPLLELLRVQMSKSLVRLKVSGPSLNLKSLEIIHCPLEFIEISATNLVSFSYCGSRPIANFSNVPNLVDLSILGPCACFLVKNIYQFSGFLSQLETLVLGLQFEIFRSFPKFPYLNNLKHLELLLDGNHARSLLFCAKLLEVSSLLQRFTLKVSKLAKFRLYRSVKEQKPKPVHQHLKVIEFIGFVGCAVDVELLLCLLGRAVSLKRLMIDPCSEYQFEMRTEIKDPELLLAARTRAKQLKTRLPPEAELVIL